MSTRSRETKGRQIDGAVAEVEGEFRLRSREKSERSAKGVKEEERASVDQETEAWDGRLGRLLEALRLRLAVMIVLPGQSTVFVQ